jgi:DNA-binding NarL/FixJ family response regulator
MTPQRVLLVEDDETTATFVCQQLVEGGLVPETVRGGLEALRKAHATTFALAIVDVDIASEPDGPETADWLRRLYGIPVVVFSMKGGAERPGVSDALVKPEAGQISRIVRGALATALARTPRDRGVRDAPLSPSDLQSPPDRWFPVASDRSAGSAESAGLTAMPPGFAQLSGREWQIIRDLIDTPSAQAVALKRQRSPHTVHNHLKSIFRKLRVHSVAELLSLMIRLSRHEPIL